MSRRKQSRPRHVDNEGINVDADGYGVGVLGSTPPTVPARDADGSFPISDLRNSSSDDGDDDSEDDNKGSDNEDLCLPAEDLSRNDKFNICQKCGACFTELSQLTTHRQRCSSRDRILMPYDPPGEGDYQYRETSFHSRLHRNLTDVQYARLDDEVISGKMYQDFRNDHLQKKRKRRDDDEKEEYQSPFRSNQRLILNLDKRMTNSLHDTRNTRFDTDSDSVIRERGYDEASNDSENEKVKSFANSEDNSETPNSKPFQNGEDPAVSWAMKAAEKGLFGGNGCLNMGSATATGSVVSPCRDGQTTSGAVTDEVSMFRNMLFQLQQQQMMQIQMIQQMRRQLIANGISPSMLPADMDLKLMSTESLASVGAAMSGLHNHRLSLEKSRDGLKSGFQNHMSSLETFQDAMKSGFQDQRRSFESSRDVLKSTPSPVTKTMSLSITQSDASRCYSPPRTDVSDKPEDDTSSPRSESPDNHTQKDEDGTPRDDITTSELEHAHRNVISTSTFDSAYVKDHLSLTSLSRNPLEILQERTAASLSSFQLPLGLRTTSSSAVIKSSSLLNSDALFASSPSLSALQKETDALKPSSLLPPLSLPMTEEDYKGYIQRGTILERSQYASDDPFFKHKCRFCHKVFGSDSALQIHVRSHTGERPFKCNICGNRFSTKGNLKVHFERHKAKYPHVKMDATPVPEHFDKHPHLMPNFSSAPLPSSEPPPPPLISRMSIPPTSQGHHPVSFSSHIRTSPLSHPSPFSPGFGGTFSSAMGPGLPPFGFMLPPRDSLMPLAHQLRMSFPPHLAISLPSVRDNNRSVEFKPRSWLSDADVIRSPPKDRPLRNVGENLSEKYQSESRSSYEPHYHSHLNEKDDHIKDEILSDDKMERNDDIRKNIEKKEGNHETKCRDNQTEFNDDTNMVVDVPEASAKGMDINPGVPQVSPLSRRSSSPRKSPTSVISWASLTSPQPMVLPGHHISMFPAHPLPLGFPGMGLPHHGAPSPFHLTSALNHTLPLPSPRVISQSPFLPPRLPLHRPQLSPPPEEGTSSLPARIIDPSENLEQYMEVQKSETSKLEALVKNIEQKITDPNQCVICHRVLSCKSALQMHYRIHTGERPFKCKICGRSFTTKGNLKTHMGVHRAKPALRIMHQCPVCHKQFTNVLVLQQHIRAHTGSLSHIPQGHFLPPHLDWPHQPPFNLHGERPYLPPLPQSLGLPREAALNASSFFRRRSDSTDSERNLNTTFSPKPSVDGNPVTSINDGKPLEKDFKPDNQSGPISNTTDSFCDKESVTQSSLRADDEQLRKNSFTFIKHEFESTFLQPDFGNTSFDPPLAALEERVKAIDSHQSQTSFQNFRNSMGLDCSFFPHSSKMPSRQNSDDGSDSASKPASPELGVEGQGHSPFDGDELACKICFLILESKSALHLHYQSHDRRTPLQCHMCSKCFSTMNSLHEHLATHGVGDTADDEFHENSEDDNSSASGTIEDDVQDAASASYPLGEEEEEEAFSDENPDMDNEDLDGEFNEPPPSEEQIASHKDEDSQTGNCQNNKMDESQDASSEKLLQSNNDSRNIACDNSHINPEPSPILESPKISGNLDKEVSSLDAAHYSQTKELLETNLGVHKDFNSAVRGPNVSRHQCMTCMKPFSSASALQIHTRTHTGDKPFQCTVCSKAFTTRGNLKVHMGTHMWNSSPSRRGRRMSIEPPLLLSHMNDHAFMLPGLHSRQSSELFYHYPLSMLNSPGPKLPEMPVGIGLNGPVHNFQAIPRPLMHGYQLKDSYNSPKDSMNYNSVKDSVTYNSVKEPVTFNSVKDSTTYSAVKDSVNSECEDPTENPQRAPSVKDLDITAKIAGNGESSPSTSSSSSFGSHSSHPVLSNASLPNTPSPGNNKENGNSPGFHLRNMGPTPWMWGAFTCHHCGHIFPSQDSLEHHFRIHHLCKVDSPARPLTKSESHTQTTPKALVA